MTYWHFVGCPARPRDSSHPKNKKTDGHIGLDICDFAWTEAPWIPRPLFFFPSCALQVLNYNRVISTWHGTILLLEESSTCHRQGIGTDGFTVSTLMKMSKRNVYLNMYTILNTMISYTCTQYNFYTCIYIYIYIYIYIHTHTHTHTHTYVYSQHMIDMCV